MKTAIVYVSIHHGNTKKLVDAIAAELDVTTADVVMNQDFSLEEYDRIGIASGIAYGKYYPQMLRYLEKHLPEGREVFFLHTAGDPRESHANSAKAITDARNCRSLGVYCCKGFDTFGPFKLVGGINKHRPNEKEIGDAVRFCREISEK